MKVKEILWEWCCCIVAFAAGLALLFLIMIFGDPEDDES